MKNKELYDRTVSILVDAYMNDTLEYTDTCACGVGNLVAANMGYQVVRRHNWFLWKTPDNRQIIASWADVFCGQSWNNVNPDHEGFTEMKSTGYTPQELFGLEGAFERGLKLPNTGKDEKNFNVLMSIIDYLDQIHENTDTTITTSSKSRFTKQLA
jgi:hypothetical protein